MILIQKPQAFSLSSPAIHHHRRHPSAPVVVQPTRTPGLLSLSKPARSSPQSRIQSLQQHQQRIRSTPKPKSAPRTATQLPAATAAENEDPRPPSDKNKVSESATPEKTHPRGRQNAKPLNKCMTRSASHSTTRGRRKPNRQPSPPLEVTQPPSSQAEAPSMPTQPQSDPFLVQPTNLKSSPFPILSPHPSGKLARRRQQQQQQQQQQKPANKIQNVSARAVPVPSTTKRTHHQQLSRSEPHVSHMPQSITAKIQPQIRAPKWDAFPICDDMTDAGDMTDSEQRVPVTPTRPRSKATRQVPFNSTPLRSAPLYGSFFQTMNTPSPPQANGGARRHRRTPSDGVFSMSSDEDHSTSLSTPSTNGPLTPTVQVLKVSRPKRRVSIGGSLPPYGATSITFKAGSSSLVSTPLASPLKQHATTVPRTRESREKQLEREAAAAYFASSNFQNSPNPEELPPPLFA